MVKTVTLHHDASTRRGRQAARAFGEGWDHQKKREWRLAIGCYTEALRHDGAMFSALANRGMCWHHLSRPTEALADYDRAMAVGTPDLQQMIRVNRGVLLTSVRRYDEALADFGADDSPESRLNASYIHLMRGDFYTGLQLYRARPTVQRWGATMIPVESLAGKDVLIVHEQGFGDAIQMARFVPAVAAVARRVHYVTPAPLLPLFADNFPNVEFSSGTDVRTAALIQKHDAFLLSMDLWQSCGLGISGKPYLRTDRNAPGGVHLLPRPQIGLSWRGRPEFSNDHNRSMKLDDLLPILSASLLGTFVSLQKDLQPGEADSLFDGGALCNDFADTAALMTQLDAVISVDTATAHLAGAVGIPTAVLLPYACDWRWGESGETTPWYDSVRIFRQPEFGAWGPAVEAASAWVRCLPSR